ncbi:MAG: DUF2225 domain-containing protein [Thermodesulfobacteriota bacterium]
MRNSSVLLACPICSQSFSHTIRPTTESGSVFGYGLDFRYMPRDTKLASEIATCPNCLFTGMSQDFGSRMPGQVRALVRSKEYINTFKPHSEEELPARGWLSLIAVFQARGLNPRDLGGLCIKGSWVARELSCPDTEDELLEAADVYLDDALRRGLTKGDPGMVMYLLGEIGRRRGAFLRGKEMLTFLGNNPRYRYPALLLTVLIEEEDCTPYWSLHAPDEMEAHSHRFKGLFPPLRSIPPGKTEFSADELSEHSIQPDEDGSRRY